MIKRVRMYKGILNKMRAVETDSSINYSLDLGGEIVSPNDWIGKNITIDFLDEIYCCKCHKKVKQVYMSGYCYSCYKNSPETDENIFKPELDMAHLGISRDMNWAKEVSLKKHFVYLANTGEVKVGVTREANIPSRWINQGADSAIIIAEAPNRHIAGCIEVYLKKFFSDKTKWKKMLSSSNEDINLEEQRNIAFSKIHPVLKNFLTDEFKTKYLNFPVSIYPEHILQTQKLKKNKSIKGKLIGIKGQYFIFESGDVMNISSHAGFLVNISF
ncbi:DUF2797 domain-containing protein [Marinilabiliaceae bacterium JC040]|jgi:hypothetical protein|nr:DUF2797 domain-containing protein [Marinilabiliaceae bacterium JC040]